MTRILLGISGSVAAMHTPALVLALRHVYGAEVQCVLTASAETFVTPKSLAVASGRPVLGEADLHSPAVEHVTAPAEADLVLVLPATANLLADVAGGRAASLLTACILAAPGPVVVAPSMNPVMWAKPAVRRNVATLRADGIGVIEPAGGVAASDGAAGDGSPPPLPAVVEWIERWTSVRGTPVTFSGRLRSAG